MADYVTKIRTTEGDKQIDYRALANKPTAADIGAAAVNHTHDERYYTESEIDSKMSSHGNHVPDTQMPDNATFLRNDNTWQQVTPANIGAAESSHDHDTSNITSGILPFARGGVGQDLTDAPNFSVIRRAGDGSNALGYTPTANGAMYATSENGELQFGTLPIAQGGTGATTAEDARTNLNAASLGSNTFDGSQTMTNNKRLKGLDLAGNEVSLIGVSDDDNLVIGGSENPKNVIMYCNKFDVRNFMQLGSDSYGTELPPSSQDTIGRIFFKKA